MAISRTKYEEKNFLKKNAGQTHPSLRLIITLQNRDCGKDRYVDQSRIVSPEIDAF